VTALAPKRPCGQPGCPALVDGRESRCERHAGEFEKLRGSAASRGYGSRWRAASKHFLSAHPLCVACLEIGRPRVATVVDHVVPHKGDDRLFWDESNWQALCRQCHAVKTARSDGRWE
jgi:5-methylcytosine-specific restriction enzyme A